MLTLLMLLMRTLLLLLPPLLLLRLISLPRRRRRGRWFVHVDRVVISSSIRVRSSSLPRRGIVQDDRVAIPTEREWIMLRVRSQLWLRRRIRRRLRDGLVLHVEGSA